MKYIHIGWKKLAITVEGDSWIAKFKRVWKSVEDMKSMKSVDIQIAMKAYLQKGKLCMHVFSKLKLQEEEERVATS